MQPTTYSLSQKHPHSEFLQINIRFENPDQEALHNLIQLPAWRPGRYQLGNFSKNIRSFQVFNNDGKHIPFQKKGKDSWLISAKGLEHYHVSYEVYTSIIDGGSTYVDEEIWYINFINCMMYQPALINTHCTVHIDIPDNWKIASSLTNTKNTLMAKDFYELVDSPLIAAKNIKHLEYKVGEVNFHLWIHGNIQLQNKGEKIIADFQKFSEEQLTTMGEFETNDYHFLFQILDQKAYHGVEHLSSTCIVLGPASEFNSETLYDNLLGISSHELFHYWNIIRIRPAEMYPYNFLSENYFTTGFVAEGVTTYYGDLFLVRCGVKPMDWYLNELNKLFKRHFENYGRSFYSVADSSTDLWVDGYELGTPNRKVSIYVKGAIIALMLDLKIILNTKAEKNLDDVMRALWNDYYKKGKGYTQADYLSVAESIGQLDLKEYETDYILGKKAVEKELENLLAKVGFTLKEKTNEHVLTHYFGLQFTQFDKALQVTATAPNSPAEQAFRIGDSIISINQLPAADVDLHTLELTHKVEFNFWRRGKVRSINLPINKNESYYNRFEIEEQTKVNDEQLKNRKKWLKV